MSTDRKHEHTFKTTEILMGESYIKTWKYHRPKISGIVKSRGFTGFYTFTDEKGNTQEALIKQDPEVIHNISEFLAGKIYKKIIPHHSAKIFLTRVNSSIENKEDAENVYVVSEFIPHFQGDLYTDIQQRLHKNPERSRHAAIEWLQVFFLQLRHLNTEFAKATKLGDFSNFGEICGPSFILNNLDTHIANIVVIQDKNQKELGVIDYGFAFRSLTSKIHPHSFTRYLWSNARRLEGWNNFLYFPESSKITSSFVYGLDKTANEDLTETIDEAFDELAKFFNIKSLMQFLIKANLADSSYRLALDEKIPNEIILKDIKAKFLTILQKRQKDLARFSAQIKMDLCCIHQNLHQQNALLGYMDSKTKKMILFEDIIFQHIEYFSEILTGKEKFKFRFSGHKKNPYLIERVKNESAYIIASLILTNENICEKYKIQTLDRAFEVIQKHILEGTELETTIKNVKTKIADAKDFLNNNESLIQMAKNNLLDKEHNRIIQQLIGKGSNPDMYMPDGSKIIDHAKDYDTRLLFVRRGAKITKFLFNQATATERGELIQARETFLRQNHHFYIFEPIKYFYYRSFSSKVSEVKIYPSDETKPLPSLR